MQQPPVKAAVARMTGRTKGSMAAEIQLTLH
jgi:hypothetical protein